MAIECFQRDLFGLEAYPRVRLSYEGASATRHFRVNTKNPELALTAMNLPGMWDVHPRVPPEWSANPCVVQGYDVQIIAGETCLVSVIYDPVTPGNRNPDDTAEDNTAYTTFQESTDQITVRADIDGNSMQEKQIEANTIELSIVCYRRLVIPSLSAWATMRNKINQNSITLPPFLQSTERILANPEELLARHLAHETVGRGLQKLTLRLAYAPAGAFKHRYTNEDLENPNLATSSERDVYPSVNFPTGAFWT